jgi:hypothetical protein
MKYSMAVLLLLLAACSQTPVLQSGPEAQTNATGLVKVENSGFDTAFAAAAADLKQYKQFQFAALDLSEIEVIDPRISNSRTSEWKFTDKDAQQMADYYKDAVEDALGGKGASLLAEAAGPGIALVKSKITRFAPTAPKYDSIDISPRSAVYSVSSANITIVTEIVDSLTQKPLVSLEDNRDMGNSMELRENTRSQYMLDMRNTFYGWAKKFKNQWEIVHRNP